MPRNKIVYYLDGLCVSLNMPSALSQGVYNSALAFTSCLCRAQRLAKHISLCMKSVLFPPVSVTPGNVSHCRQGHIRARYRLMGPV